MVRIVIHDDGPVILALVLKTPLRAAIGLEAVADLLRRNAEQTAGRQGRERVVDIVFSRHGKLNARQGLAVLRRCKGRVAAFVKADIRRVIVRFRGADRGYPPLKITDNLPVIPNAVVNDERTVLRHALHEAAERMADIVQVLEKIEVIRLNI